MAVYTASGLDMWSQLCTEQLIITITTITSLVYRDKEVRAARWSTVLPIEHNTGYVVDKGVVLRNNSTSFNRDLSETVLFNNKKAVF